MAVLPCASASNNNSNIPRAVTPCGDKRVKWRHEAILNIITLREEYDHDFRSTNTKNEVMWKKVAIKMKEMGFDYSSTQCNDKWKYLKGKYAAKKDNMSVKGSGEERMDFEYYNAMDSFLGKKHSITPIAIASSSRGDTGKQCKLPSFVVIATYFYYII